MKQKRRYLKDLIPVDINKLVLETGYFEIETGGNLLSLAPERHPNGRYTSPCSRTTSGSSRWGSYPQCPMVVALPPATEFPHALYWLCYRHKNQISVVIEPADFPSPCSYACCARTPVVAGGCKEVVG
jgi:hypothetical protein